MILQTNSNGVAVDSLVSQGNLYQLCADGTVWQENSPDAAQAFFDINTTLSQNAWVSLGITTSWIKPGGTIQGQGWLHQVQLNIQNTDWANWNVGIQYDYNQGGFNFPPSWQWTSAEVSAFPNINGEAGSGWQTQVSLRPPQMRCTAFQLTFYDSQPTTNPMASTGQGPILTAISVDIEGIEGLARIPSAQRG